MRTIHYIISQRLRFGNTLRAIFAKADGAAGFVALALHAALAVALALYLVPAPAPDDAERTPRPQATPRPQGAILPIPTEPIEKVTTPVAIDSKSQQARVDALPKFRTMNFFVIASRRVHIP